MRKLSKMLCGSLLAAGLVLGSTQVSRAQYPGGAGGAGGAAGRNSATAEARKRISEMQAELKELKAEREKMKEAVLAELLEEDKWKDTASKHKKAKAAYESAKKKALAALKAKPAYKALAKERDALAARQDELSGKTRGADPDEIARVGTALAEKGTALKNMEKEAVEQDEKTLTAKDALAAAEKEKKALDAKVEDELLSDADYDALEVKVEQSQTQIASAREQLTAQKRSEAQSRAGQRKSASSSSGSGGKGGMGSRGKMGKGGKSPY